MAKLTVSPSDPESTVAFGAGVDDPIVIGAPIGKLNPQPLATTGAGHGRQKARIRFVAAWDDIMLLEILRALADGIRHQVY
ncbi:MAG: hypothetical protein AAGB04_02170 [Pseudomonadota bacterium]